MTAERSAVLRNAREWVREKLGSDRTGHDFAHIERVVRYAGVLAREEDADPFVCELAAWLHDLSDAKLVSDKQAAERETEDWMHRQGVLEPDAAHVMTIIRTMSFAGGGGPRMATPEGQVVQDADRLDALGAIGIARTFVYAGARGHPLHDPMLPPRTRMTPDEYRGGGTAIHHFYEKLLLLKDRMNTDAGRRMAEERHRFLEEFLRQFLAEWDGRDN